MLPVHVSDLLRLGLDLALLLELSLPFLYFWFLSSLASGSRCIFFLLPWLMVLPHVPWSSMPAAADDDAAPDEVS